MMMPARSASLRRAFSAALSALLIPSSALRADTRSIYFTDVTEQAGIRFRHTNGAEGDLHLPETLGAGGAFLDYDGDGDMDLYLVNGGNLARPQNTSPSVLYRNNGDGTFTDVTSNAGVGNATRYGMGCAVGDYDNDGDPDLYVTNFGPDVLYRNSGDGTFTDVTAQAGVGDPLWSSSATFFDFDRDGDLDLYVANYVLYALDAAYPPCIEGGLRTYCHPRHFEGAPDRLYRNNGDGTFTDVTDAAHATDPGGMYQGKGLGVVAADLDGNGYPDLYIANDDTPNFLFLNNGDGTFTESAVLAGCAYSMDAVAQAGMGVDAADYNGDGRLDVFVTNLSYETNALYRNNGDGTFSDVVYEARLGEESYLFVGFGTGFADFDNDGDLDLFVANGHILPNIGEMTDVLTYPQPLQVFANQGDGTFADVSATAGEAFGHEFVSRGAIFGDCDNDGDTDVVVTQSNGRAILLRNDSKRRGNWLRVRCIGTASNRDGVGARVLCTVAGRTLLRELHTGASYLSSHDPRVLFGLGDAPAADGVEIRWPSGVVQVLSDVLANQEITVVEPGER
jgi:hypothetical protein